MSADFWYTQGVLGAVLAVLGWAIWRVMLWARVAVVEPMVKSHLALVEALNEHMPKQTAAMLEIAEHQRQILERVVHQLPGGKS